VPHFEGPTKSGPKCVLAAKLTHRKLGTSPATQKMHEVELD
jgi:hypothetical protein